MTFGWHSHNISYFQGGLELRTLIIIISFITFSSPRQYSNAEDIIPFIDFTIYQRDAGHKLPLCSKKQNVIWTNLYNNIYVL